MILQQVTAPAGMQAVGVSYPESDERTTVSGAIVFGRAGLLETKWQASTIYDGMIAVTNRIGFLN